MKASPIEGTELTSWGVLPGGKQISLGFIVVDGSQHRIILPVEALSALLMTLPRMLQAALDERVPDGSLRLVQHLGKWQLEQQASDDDLILKLSTMDGFEVAFVLDDAHVRALGAALLETPRQTASSLVRRLN